MGGVVSAPRRTSATEAVRLQDDLRKFWRTSRGTDYFQAWAEMRRRDGAPVYVEFPEERARLEVVTLSGARTYFVTSDMTALALHAVESMPEEPLLETDLPTPNGFLVFEEGVPFPDVRGKTVVMLAFAWRRVLLHGGVPALLWTYYSDVSDPRDEYAQAHEDKRPRESWPVRAVLLAEDVEEFGVATASAEDIVGHYVHAAGVESVKRTLAMMHTLPRALFSLLNSSVTLASNERADRAERRRLERAQSPLTGDVVVVRLRRAHLEGATSGESPVEWSRRWIVSGHWRNAWRPSVQAHRRVWVAPFVKGPEGKPLVIPRRVHVLER